MKRLFLYRLLKHSIPAFVPAILFMVCYSVFFYKKMDMVFFPYNSMYTVDFTKSNNATTYAVKMNGELIRISHLPYWKKDLLETSLYGYCKYLRQDRRVFLENYLQQRSSAEWMRNFLIKSLIPDKNAASTWPHWYAGAAGYSIPANATIEFMQYNFIFDKGKALLLDSASIYKTNLP